MNDDTFEPGPLAEVHCIADADESTLVFVRHLRHAPSAVWAALTDPERLRQWAPFTTDRDLGQVGAVTITMIDGETTDVSAARVTRCEPPSLLEYTWGDDVLRWELEAAGPGTRLTLHHTLENRSDLPRVAAGWHICLVVAERLLDGHPIGPIVGNDAMNYGWQALHDRYAETLGI